MRSFLVLTTALLALSTAALTADAATLTSKNSVVAETPFAEYVEASSPDCAIPAVGSIPVPADSLSVKVASPKVGYKSSNSDVTAIDTVAPGFSITFTAVPDLCDPVANGYPPGTALPWRASVSATGTYKHRVAACLRPYFDKYSNKPCKARPRKVFTGIEGIERGFRQFYAGIKWKNFGGTKATGKGKLKEDCLGGRCSPARKVKIVADKAKYCVSSKSVEYTRLTSYSGGKLWFRQRNVC